MLVSVRKVCGVMSCEFEEKIERLHDGELDAAERVPVETHLAGCGECAAYFAQLRQITDRFHAASGRFELELPLELAARLHARIDDWMDRSILRLAMSFASVAAVVLIGAMVGLLQLGRPSVEPPQPWEGTAVALQADSGNTSSSTSSSGSSSGNIEPDLILAELSRKDMH